MNLKTAWTNKQEGLKFQPEAYAEGMLHISVWDTASGVQVWELEVDPRSTRKEVEAAVIYKDRLEDWISLMEIVPDCRIDQMSWSCRTTHCVGGWLAVSDRFRNAGGKSLYDGSPFYETKFEDEGVAFYLGDGSLEPRLNRIFYSGEQSKQWIIDRLKDLREHV